MDDTVQTEAPRQAMPPDYAPAQLRLPNVIHTQHTFLRLFVQLDFDLFVSLLKTPRMMDVFDLNAHNYKKYFVAVINAYKKNPLAVLAVCDRATFEAVGAVALVAGAGVDGTVELILAVPEQLAAEVAQQVCLWAQPFGLTVVNHQTELAQLLREAGFEDSGNGCLIFQTSTQ